jgi:hypothetical protein
MLCGRNLRMNFLEINLWRIFIVWKKFEKGNFLSTILHICEKNCKRRVVEGNFLSTILHICEKNCKKESSRGKFFIETCSFLLFVQHYRLLQNSRSLLTPALCE